MNDTLIQLLFLVHVASCLGIVGIIWYAQIVPDPLLASIGPPESSASEKRRTAIISRFAALLMLFEGFSALMLFWFPPAGVSKWLLSAGLILLILIWALTARVRMRRHKALSREFNADVRQQLVVSNWWRTIAWTLRGVLVLWMVWTSMSAGSLNHLETAGGMRIEVGKPAPDFSATTQDGQQIHLSDYLGKRGVILFFYPRDGTSVCTKEACAFRDSYEKFVAAGVEVIGVSSDDEQSHRDFIQQHKLSFPLISDKDGSLRTAFAVPNSMGVIPGRVTYVIDQDGIIRQIFSALFASDEHVQQALAAVNGFKTSSP